jgi:hypothetical protein
MNLDFAMIEAPASSRWEITFALRGGRAATYTIRAATKAAAIRSAKSLCRSEIGSPGRVLRAVELG